MKGLRRVISVLVIGACLLSSLSARAEPQPLDLKTCFSLAKEQVETLKISLAEIQRAEAQYQESRSVLFPQLSARLSERFTDSGSFSGSNSNSVDTSYQGGTGPSNGWTDRTQGYLTLTQQVFSGFRDLLIAEAAKELIAASTYDYGRTIELLYQDVAQIFFQIQFYDSDITTLHEIRKVVRERVEQLEEFVKLGKSKNSEQLNAMADLSEIESQITQLEGVRARALETLAFLTGVPAAEIKIDSAKPAYVVDKLDNYLARIPERKDLKALDIRTESSNKLVQAAQRERWPNITLEGNYYPLDEPDQGEHADARLLLSVPVFDGGRISARVAQQQALASSDALRAQQAKRQAEREVRSAYSDAVSAALTTNKLRRYAADARKSYEAQKVDYRLGLVNNLDVMVAIRAMLNADRRVLESEYQLRGAQVALQVAAGELPQ